MTKISKQEIFKNAKEIILNLFGYFDEKKITPSLKLNLVFDEYDKKDIIMQFDLKYGGCVPYTNALQHALTLGDFCDTLCDEINKQKAKQEDITLLQNNKNSLFYRLKNIFVKQN